ncbi:hypothetical protein V8J82_06075 [Gymnodinialimonas sp. 2305UL16-5]|uniref:HAD family hydrolase n=1 Tax=Gymnodinialimonas mytili TaxID=3126503 RepID=UPI0030AC6E09
MAPDLIVWDFDGVLNRNVVDGRFLWSEHLDTDLGLSRDSLQAFLFRSGRMLGVIRGEEDLRDVVAEWLAAEGAQISPDAMLDYWFAKDGLPDAEVLGWLEQVDTRHVIGTNNETRRVAYIEGPMGFSERVEKVFASGRLRVAKPDAGFFEAIEAWSGVAVGSILLVDDNLPNVEAAQARGWAGFHFVDETRSDLPALLGIA